MQIDLAVAIVVGTAFTAVVKAFVSLSFGPSFASISHLQHCYACGIP